MKDQIDYETFAKVDMRVGIITGVHDFPEARKPAYKLDVFFGNEIGTKKTSAQITNYSKDELIGRKVIAVVNFPPKRIANFLSEVLVLGAITDHGVMLLSVDDRAEPGSPIA